MSELRTKATRTAEAIATIGAAPLVLFANAILIILAAAYIAIFVPKEIPANIIRDNILPALIPILFVQLLLQQYLLRQNTDKVIKKLVLEESIIFPPETVNHEIIQLIKSDQVQSMSIICFGTNKFGKILDAVKDFHPDIKVSVIMFSSKSTFILENKDEKKLLETVYNDLSESPNITIYKTDILPTIRAIAMYNERKQPIWCSMQSYHLFSSRLPSIRGERISPTIVAREKNSDLMQKLVDYVHKEFARLKKESVKHEV
jgi:hypothetical protein